MVTDQGKRQPREWVFLLHRLPREPSAPRIALWRSLRRLGAVLLSDGLVALPASARTIEHLEWLAASIDEQGGAASVWVARPTASDNGRRMADQSRSAVDREYLNVIRQAEAIGFPSGDAARTLRRLRGELRRIATRDFFGAPSARQAREAVESLTKEVATA
ncbi:MAG TPA: Chromate resistance protein ChrB [Candidatus Limnocylindria bacterium]|nr:Chromate resistance protein ChrB [Candidatus Limnocylindria bacterium]